MNEVYAQGFIDKCAEYGVDPEQLIKNAQALSQGYHPSSLDNSAATQMWATTPVNDVRGVSPYNNVGRMRHLSPAGALAMGIPLPGNPPAAQPGSQPGLLNRAGTVAGNAFSKFKNFITAPARMGVAAGQRMAGQ